jgi:hypothetical protein
LREFGAFRLREGDFVSIGHAGEKSSKVKFSMRKYKCYEILGSWMLLKSSGNGLALL